MGRQGIPKGQLREAERGGSPSDSWVQCKVCPGSQIWAAAVLTERPQRRREQSGFCREVGGGRTGGERPAPLREVRRGAGARCAAQRNSIGSGARERGGGD